MINSLAVRVLMSAVFYNDKELTILLRASSVVLQDVLLQTVWMLKVLKLSL